MRVTPFDVSRSLDGRRCSVVGAARSRGVEGSGDVTDVDAEDLVGVLLGEGDVELEILFAAVADEEESATEQTSVSLNEEGLDEGERERTLKPETPS